MVDYSRRRERVLEQIPGAGLVLFSNPERIRNNDVEHEYRQDSDFHYLCGYDEPESVLVLRHEAPRFTLFVRPRDPEREVWDGPRAGVDGAVARFGADAAHPIAELAERLPTLLSGLDAVHYRLGRERAHDDVVLRTLDAVRRLARRGVKAPETIVNPGVVLHEMRLRKEPAELDLMRRAAAITREGHLAAMAFTRPDAFEYETEAVLGSAFRRNGSERHAYSPIVGSGPNATILHYRRNDRQMLAGELLLIDAGCEFGYYASDVTRTFPVSGKFSGPQRAVYEIVLRAELEAIAACRIGASVEAPHDVAIRVLTQGLIELGLIEGPLSTAVEQGLYKPWYMHRTSHWLGMDVHDVGSYHVSGKPRVLEPGMTLTVEPGLYFSAGDTRVPEPFRGIGIRIEDDVLVTESDPEVLTASIPKHPDEVERACAA
jgi:Xaa-Pro aminopeptidase